MFSGGKGSVSISQHSEYKRNALLARNGGQQRRGGLTKTGGHWVKSGERNSRCADNKASNRQAEGDGNDHLGANKRISRIQGGKLVEGVPIKTERAQGKDERSPARPQHNASEN